MMNTFLPRTYTVYPLFLKSITELSPSTIVTIISQRPERRETQIDQDYTGRGLLSCNLNCFFCAFKNRKSGKFFSVLYIRSQKNMKVFEKINEEKCKYLLSLKKYEFDQLFPWFI